MNRFGIHKNTHQDQTVKTSVIGPITYPMVQYCLIKHIYGDLLYVLNAPNIGYCQRPKTGLDGSLIYPNMEMSPDDRINFM